MFHLGIPPSHKFLLIKEVTIAESVTHVGDLSVTYVPWSDPLARKKILPQKYNFLVYEPVAKPLLRRGFEK
jgi:hypothetical protein